MATNRPSLENLSIFFRYFPFFPKNPTCGAQVDEESTRNEMFATRLSHFAFCSTCGGTGPKKGGEIAKKTRRAAGYGKNLKISPQIGQIRRYSKLAGFATSNRNKLFFLV